jgi:hypothetical protein
MSVTIYTGNNANVIEIRDVTNTVTTAVDTGATVSVTLTDKSGAEVAGATWPVNMPHVSAGLYRVTIPPPLTLVEDREYNVKVLLAGSAGEPGEINCTATATKRVC